MGGINFDEGCFEKNCRMGVCPPPPPHPPHALLTMGNPVKENKMQNMFKVNNKSTRCCPHTLFWSGLPFLADFKH